jgi:hypothetical protein
MEQKRRKQGPGWKRGSFRRDGDGIFSLAEHLRPDLNLYRLKRPKCFMIALTEKMAAQACIYRGSSLAHFLKGFWQIPY